MATRRERRRKTETSRPRPVPTGPDPGLGIGPVHIGLVVGGILVAVLGYWLLSEGSISAAPFLLILAYLVLIPIGLSLPGRRRRKSEDGSDRR